MVGLGSSSQEEKAELLSEFSSLQKALKDPREAERLPRSSPLTRGSRNPLQIHTWDAPQGPEPALPKSMEHLHPRAAGPEQK